MTPCGRFKSIMTAKDILNPFADTAQSRPQKTVDAGMTLFEVLPLLLDTPRREVGVTDGDALLGVIDQTSMLEGLGRLIAPRDDSSVITVECAAHQYSASQLAHAVEDSDAHLVDLLTSPGRDGNITVTLRVRHSDPMAAVHSLERYGYHVVEARGSHGDPAGSAIALDRLLSLRTLLNV